MARIPAALALALMVSCAPDTAPESLDADAHARVDARSSTLIVHLMDDDLTPLPGTDVHRRAAREQLAERMEDLAERADQVLRTLPADVTVVRRYASFPILALEVGSDASFRALEAHPLVVSVERESIVEAFDTQSLALIQQPAAEAAGHIGEGTSVVVIDTGADWTHPDFGTCTSVGSPGCRVIYAADTAPDDGSRDDGGHGTNVTAIVGSVAPGADLIALDAFRGGAGWSSDILAALDWVVANEATYNVASVNMSLGAGAYTSTCTDVYSSAIAAVRASGVSVVIASGNNAYTNAVASPACNASAITVGAVYDAPFSGIGYSSCSDGASVPDQVTCFSNTAPFLDILAPGAMITAGGHTMAGTSQAAPHVAGAVAVLREAWPDATLDELEQLLLDGGDLVTDHRTGLQFPRLNVAEAADGGTGGGGGGGGGGPSSLVGSIVIADGATGTRTPNVTLTLDAPGATEVCLTNTDVCAVWLPYVSSTTWRLGSGTGPKTVTAWFRAGNIVSDAVSDSIEVDKVKPLTGTLTSASLDGAVELAWDGFTDAGSGVATYRVMQAAGTRAPSSCTATPAWRGPEDGVIVQGLTNGQPVSFAVCAEDGAGNISRPAKVTVTPKPESDPPVGSVLINGGAPWTNNTTATLSLAATDASGVASYCVSTRSTTCSRFTAMQPTTTSRLSGSSGPSSVYVWYRDAWGTTSEPVSATIGIDRGRPLNGTVTATPELGGVTLSWVGFTDALSGVASYQLVMAEGTRAPRNCTGPAVWSGAATATTITGLAVGAPHAFRVCAVDAAGNLSTGATVTASAPGEVEAPTGTIVLAGGAEWTEDLSVAVSLTAFDLSGVTHACLSDTPDACTSWFPMRDDTTWTLQDEQGTHTVYAWFRDSWGNVSEPVAATISVDSAAPALGTATALAGPGSITLSWSGMVDEGAGTTSYSVYVAHGSTAPADCSGVPIYQGMDTTFELQQLLDQDYAFRICAEDALGHMNAGTTVLGHPLPEVDPPVGTVTLENGATMVNHRLVSIHLEASDASGVTHACLSSQRTCTPEQWFEWVDDTVFELNPGTGSQNVYARFRDTWGNESTAYRALVVLDETAPTDGDVTATWTGTLGTDVFLSWSGYADDRALDHYVVYGLPGDTPPAACDDAAHVAVTPRRAQVPASEETWSFRVCAVDTAGNVSQGSTVTLQR